MKGCLIESKPLISELSFPLRYLPATLLHLQISVSVCPSVSSFNFLPSSCTSPGEIPSTDTLWAHPEDLNREASSGEPCSHDAGLCLPGSACSLIIPCEGSCLPFFPALCVSMCGCVFLDPPCSSAHHIFSLSSGFFFFFSVSARVP